MANDKGGLTLWFGELCGLPEKWTCALSAELAMPGQMEVPFPGQAPKLCNSTVFL